MCTLFMCLCLVSKSCLALCNSMDCSLSGSSVHGIFQARILEWVAMSSSRRHSRPRDQTHISCIVWGILYHLSNLGNPIPCTFIEISDVVFLSCDYLLSFYLFFVWWLMCLFLLSPLLLEYFISILVGFIPWLYFNSLFSCSKVIDLILMWRNS